MSLARDLAWQDFEKSYRTSIAHELARYALGVSYEALPPEVVHAAKRTVLDTLSCAVGASEAPGRPIAERTARAIGGEPEATVFGSGLKTTAINATLVNCFMVRYLDCNDMGGGGHNNESVPPILAAAEREKATGRAFLTSVVLSYELGARFMGSVNGRGLGYRGWSGDSRAAFTLPGPLGKLMGLNENQIANAIGIAGAHAPSLGILDADREELAMTKNLRFGFTAQHAILACLLAKEGFTGFTRIVEGDKGLREVLLNNEMDLDRLVDFNGWRILNVGFKTICQNWNTQTHILATLSIVKENDLKPSDIAAVRLITNPRDARHTTVVPAKKYPRSTENATHSAFYGNAIAIKERDLGPEQMRPEKFTDPVVLDLIEKITVEADPSLPDAGPAASTEITTTDGRRLVKRVDVPHGDITDPLTDAEIEDKFRRYAGIAMSPKQIQSIIDTVWRVDTLDTVADLTRLMVWE
ncbi:MAG: MmgE/PrpD family protein [Chloroflexi bacterium]|nr:MmgE/PrpD family protein [Chloroflexota bacterium]